MLDQIIHADIRDGMKIHLKYEDGCEGIVGFSGLAERGGVFGQLRSPDFFQQVRLKDEGRVLAWPDEVEFCADALKKNLKSEEKV